MNRQTDILNPNSDNGTIIRAIRADVLLLSTEITKILAKDALRDKKKDGGDTSVKSEHVQYTGQTGSIAAASFKTPKTTGLYDVGFYLLVSTADAGSGATVKLTISWNDGVAARTIDSKTIAVNATNYTNEQSAGGRMGLVWLGSGSINYSTTVTGAIGSAVYDIVLTIKEVEH